MRKPKQNRSLERLLFSVAPRRSVSTSTHTPEPAKPPIPSANQQAKQTGQNERGTHEEFTQTSIRTRNFATSPIAPPVDSNEIRKEKSLALSIAAAPSFPLRSTAVCNLYPQDLDSVEQAPSAHKDISIFAYHLTQKDLEQSVTEGSTRNCSHCRVLSRSRLVITRKRRCSRWTLVSSKRRYRIPLCFS